ncbi:MAG: ECF transporter S component [Spirochaetota bacterium]|nr:ECF transporter S component [Spirochaetota bacterium]
MNEQNSTEIKHLPAFRIATLAVLIALTALFTYIIRIPVAPTRGYINFGDVSIFFTAMIFGPLTAFITGGAGTALADLISGYSQWAPFTFLAHGLQGLVIGLVIKAGRRISSGAGSRISSATSDAAGPEQRGGIRKPGILTLLTAFLAGTVVMVGIYFLTGGLMVGFAAAATEIPGNILQNVAGVLIGTPLALAVWKAYPPIRFYTW